MPSKLQYDVWSLFRTHLTEENSKSTSPFLNKNCHISKFEYWRFFAVSRSIFELYRLFLLFWNSQSLIYKMLLLEKYAIMNSITEIKEILCVLFLLPDSIFSEEQ